MRNSAILQEVDAQTLKQWMDDGKAELIDIREQDEYAREHIDGSTLMPMTDFDAAALPGDRTKIGVFHCNSGNRTQMSAEMLLTSGFSEVHHLVGGIAAWKKVGLQTNVDRRVPINLMRQVQIAAGSLVVLGVLLGLVISPWFVFLSGFVGAGLAFSGLTGTCAMANILGRLPYNRAPLENAAG